CHGFDAKINRKISNIYIFSANTIYFTEIEKCIDGKLESAAPPDSSTAALAQAMVETTTDTKRTDMVKEIYEEVSGLQWCWESGSMKEYGRNKFCCRNMLLNKVDNYNRERGCCSNTIYFTQIEKCIDGKLERSAPPDSSTAALAQAMVETTTDTKRTDMVKEICEKVFAIVILNKYNFRQKRRESRCLIQHL
ncbi:hypothetical protein CHS0354_018904, partial [Potamilus streckersoni]